VRHQLGDSQHHNSILNEQLDMVEKENESVRKRLSEWQTEVSNITQQKTLQAQTQIAALEENLHQYQRRYENLKAESDAIRNTAEKLRSELAEERARAVTMRVEPERKQADAETQKEITGSRFTPSTWQTKNDLTKISGVGPVIQKRLNEIGIYSFQQIAELTPEMIDRVAVAIRFFPDRIGRDNWIGQAAALMKGQKK
jgi:predicted flap endonuclease-1-like 5' DNA nuclease